MSVYVAVHRRPGSFSDRWLEYCSGHGVPNKIVDGYRSDIISQLAGTGALLWHWTHGSPQDLLMARHVIMGAEVMGLKVFPNTPTCWHFDDKIAQKYLLEAVGAPLVPTHVFYQLEDAMAWARSTTYPKVFNLRRGAGSLNVRLVRTAGEMEGLATYVPGIPWLRGGTGGTSSACYCYSVWLRHLVMARRAGLRPSLDVVAELGPGDSIGTGLAALLSGAGKHVGLDVVPFASNAQNVRIFEELVALFKTRADIHNGHEFQRDLRIGDRMYFTSGDRNV
jgi:hypothetical protein